MTAALTHASATLLRILALSSMLMAPVGALACSNAGGLGSPGGAGG